MDVVICYAKRSPIGKWGGALSHIRPDDLLAQLLQNFLNRHQFDFNLIDDFIVGNSNGAGEDNRNVARMSALLTNLPESVPAFTVNRLCGSSLEAIGIAFAKIASRSADCILVGGVESMSRAPYVLAKAKSPMDRFQEFFDTSIGWRFPNPALKKKYGLLSMGETAEEVATLLKITREDQDLFALNSHRKAVNAINLQLFKEEIDPVSTPSGELIDTDEGPRPTTSLEGLAKLKPAFRDGGTVTAGNASSLNDGAALLLVTSRSFAKENHLIPLAQIDAYQAAGRNPNTMGLGPVDATLALCKKNPQITLKSFDIIELNEAFAAQAIGCIRSLDINPDIVNPKGGAIALGHPLGQSGARITTTLLHHFKQYPQKYKRGLATMCIGLGQGVSLSLTNQC